MIGAPDRKAAPMETMVVSRRERDSLVEVALETLEGEADALEVGARARTNLADLPRHAAAIAEVAALLDTLGWAHDGPRERYSVGLADPALAILKGRSQGALRDHAAGVASAADQAAAQRFADLDREVVGVCDRASAA